VTELAVGLTEIYTGKPGGMYNAVGVPSKSREAASGDGETQRGVQHDNTS
jgi:hypothetical protein